MTSLDPWQPSNPDRADLSAGQRWFDTEFTTESDFLAGEAFENGRPTYASMGGEYLGRDAGNPYDPFVSSIALFDDYAHQQDPGLTLDPFMDPLDMNTPRFTACSYPGFREETSMTRSNSSTETECSNEDDQQGRMCQECNKLFRNLQELDQHTKRVPHKAWRCAEPSCGKTYARRDTFLRHRATHKDKGHACSICSHHNKQKVFKRKDHLKEHIRNCHSKGVEPTTFDGVRSV
jgi:hypothetical protein